MTTISSITSQISPATERAYHQSNLLGDWIANGLVVSEPYDSHAKAQGLRVLRWPG